MFCTFSCGILFSEVNLSHVFMNEKIIGFTKCFVWVLFSNKVEGSYMGLIFLIKGEALFRVQYFEGM